MKKHNNVLPFVSPKKNATLDLFCMHYAGGSSAVFREWDQIFPDWIAVRPIELPGRGTRLLETPLTDPEALITQIGEAIQQEIQRPWALFGHSLGAALGYRICQNLQEKTAPLAFFPAGRHAPTLYDPAPKRGHLSDSDLIEAVRDLNGSPEEVLQNKELMELLLPMIRADFILSETIQKTEAPLKLDCPVHVFAGSDDPEVPISTLSQWQDSCRQKVAIEIIQGDHFFLHDHAAVLTICQQISRCLTPLLHLQASIQNQGASHG